jgi:hypothetical protein
MIYGFAEAGAGCDLTLNWNDKQKKQVLFDTYAIVCNRRGGKSLQMAHLLLGSAI